MTRKLFLTAATFLLFTPFANGDAASKNKLLDEWLNTRDFSDTAIRTIVGEGAFQYVKRDPRIRQVDVPDVSAKLVAKLDKEALAKQFRNLWDTTFTEAELAYLVNLNNSAVGKKYDSAMTDFRVIMISNVQEQLAQINGEPTKLPYQESPVKAPTQDLTPAQSKASAFTKFIWRMFPETKICEPTVPPPAVAPKDAGAPPTPAK
jgi:hypothetical protein